MKPIYKQIEEYLDYCEFTRQMSPMTMHQKRHVLRHFIKVSKIDSLEKLDNGVINRWVLSQSKLGVTNRTINVRMAHILAMVRYYREMGLEMPIKLPLIQKLKEGPARRVFYTKDEIDFVLQFASDFQWLLIKISFDTGLRITELSTLRLDNFFGRMIKFIGKGFKSREAYIPHTTQQRLDKWISNYEIKDYLWIKGNGDPYGVDEIRIIMRCAFHEAARRLDSEIKNLGDPTGEKSILVRKLKNFYPHSLRHSFGSDIQKNGYDLMEIQQMMGHSSPETTQRYLHGLDGRLEDLFLRLEQKREENIAA